MSITKAVRDTLVAGSVDGTQAVDGDIAFVRRVQRGDVSAFDHLILKYRERLFSIIYNR